MSLDCTGTTDRVDHGSAAAIDNLDPFTWFMWVKFDTLTNARRIYSKLLGQHKLNVGGSPVDELVFARARATTWTDYQTNDSPLAAGVWTFIAVTFNSSAGAGEIVNLYTGTLSTSVAERSYGVATDGGGALNTDAAGNWTVMGQSDGDSGSGVDGQVAVGALFNRVLTLGELQAQQFNPHVESGCLIFSHYYNTGTVADWSGNANAGTVIGATVAAHVPLGLAFGRRGGWRGAFTAAAAPSVLAYGTRMMMTGIGA